MRVISTERLPIKLWLDGIEENALQQAKNIANLPFAYKWIAIMPDSHSGYGMPIGGVLATKQVIIPNCVGVDIGCGMMAVRTSLSEIDTDTLKSIMSQVRTVIPLGFSHQKEDQQWDGFNDAPDISIIQRELSSSRKQLGTLGGGNHFIEIQMGSDGYVWLMLHSGSRNFGLKTATEYHKKALRLCEKWHSMLPDKELAFLPIESDEGAEYYDAMKYCLKFAQANRDLMMARIETIVHDITGATIDERVNIHHNYAAIENHYGENVFVHRKGATKATLGLAGIIPGSMGTSSYIVEGLGNPESFMSCSHGAGRSMGRKQAIRELNLEDEQRKMEGIVHELWDKSNLDEAPGSYKDIDTVMANQADLVKVKVHLKPLAVIKG